MKNAIAVFGSSVNPPHFVHKYLLEELSKHFRKVIFLPAGARQDKKLITGQHRRQMIEILLDNDWRQKYSNISIDYSDIEGRNTPTILYLRNLQLMHPHEEIYFSLGSDLLISREEFGGKSELEATWNEGEKLLREFKIALFPRPGYSLDQIKNLSSYYLVIKEGTLPEFSSTKIRQLLKEGLDPQKYISADLFNYIQEHKLYS